MMQWDLRREPQFYAKNASRTGAPKNLGMVRMLQHSLSRMIEQNPAIFRSLLINVIEQLGGSSTSKMIVK